MIIVRNAEKQMVAGLLRYAELVALSTEISMSRIGRDAVNDSKILFDLQNGSRGLTLQTYDRMIDWLDKHADKEIRRIVKKSLEATRA